VFDTRCFPFLGLTLTVAFATAALTQSAPAQTRLDARYTMTLGGLPIGEGNWVIDINNNEYSATASGGTTGLMKVFTGGHGNTASRGTLTPGKLQSSVYAATIITRKKTDQTRLSVNGGNVKDLTLDPPQDKDSERIPITEDAKRGVQDPMNATLLRASGNGNPLIAEACDRKLAVFDGRLRYDLQLAYKRMDKVKADKGYAGPVVVCAVTFAPVAGFIPSRAAIQYMVKMRDLEIWLAPIAGTRVLVPFRAEGPTPIGKAVLEAEQFVTLPLPTREASKEALKDAAKEPIKASVTGASNTQ
jgi:hypothetical protein